MTAPQTAAYAYIWSLAFPQMFPDLECAQHLQERFVAMRCAEVSANLFSQPLERVRLVMQLQRDATVLQQMLRETHGRLNKLALINSLPPEILGIIFAFTVEDDQPRVPNGSAPGYLGWIRVTHVCKSWRDICMKTPSLWAHSLGRLPRALPVFLERAGDHVPLDFYLSQDWDTWIHTRRRHVRNGVPTSILNVTNELCARSPRVVNLELHFPLAQLALRIELTLHSHHFSGLRRLRIATLPLYHTAGQIHEPLRLNNLQVVEFIGFFTPFVAPCLTSLTLQGIADRVDEHILYDVLHTSPLLEVIVLTGLERVRLGALQNLPAVHLPRLAWLCLDTLAPGQEIDMFINMLAIPCTVQLDIRRAVTAFPEDYALIHTLFKATEDGEKIALEFIGPSLNICTVRRQSRRSRWRRVKASVNFGNISNLTYHLPKLHLDPYFNKITHLTICPLPYATTSDWARVFDLARSVKILEVSARASHSHSLPFAPIFDTLGRCFDEDSGIPLRIYLPNLETVVLDSDIEPGMLSLQNDIVSCLETRAFAEALPVRMLFLEGFEEDIVVTGKLRNIVDTVVWKDSC